MACNRVATMDARQEADASQFRRDLVRWENRIIGQEPSKYKKMVDFSEAVNKALNIYQNTCSSSRRYILVGKGIKHMAPLVHNFGLITETTARSRGAILGSRNWTLLDNDAFIYGAIRKRKGVYFVGEPRLSDLWNEAKRRPTTLGREMVMLLSSGYRCVRSSNQIAFKPPQDDSELPSIRDLWRAVDDATHSFFDFLIPREPTAELKIQT